MRASSELCRRWSVPLGGESSRDIPGEHAGILEATIAHDTTRAVDLLTAHIQRATDILLTSEDTTVTVVTGQDAEMTQG
jgi:DNA-binding GntR family transcriptional regulator